MVKKITIPNFELTAFYYPDFKKALQDFRRLNAPEITEVAEEEPFIQLENSFSLVGHVNNVNLDIVGNENFLSTARLLDSVKNQLKLIDFKLEQYKPAVTDIVLELSKAFPTATNIIGKDGQVSTNSTPTTPEVVFEADKDNIINNTDKPDSVFSFDSPSIQILANTGIAAEKITLQTQDFVAGTDFTAGTDDTATELAVTATNLAKAINASTVVSITSKLFAYAVTDTVHVGLLDLTIETVTLTTSDVVNFTVIAGAFTVNNKVAAAADSSLFNMFGADPKPGSVFYVGHATIMFDNVDFVFDTPADTSDFVGVWEFYDNVFDEENPDVAVNNGSDMTFTLTTFLGTTDRTGTVVKVKSALTNTEETLVSFFSGGLNKVTSIGLFGQSSPSTIKTDYVVGSDWNEVSDLVDGSIALTVDGEIAFTLPQSITENWIKRTITTVEGFYLRFRVISVSTPVNPIVDRVKIDSGLQFVLFASTQGLTTVENPLGSSDGSSNLELVLANKPLFENTLVIEVDEGIGLETWSSVDNFLASTDVDQHYTVDFDADDKATVKFGDGISGKIPTAGVDNIKATYKLGADIFGNVGANTITNNRGSIAFINNVFNPRPAIGFELKDGFTPADIEELKITGPASLRTRDRGVTPEDIAFLAENFETSTGSKIVSRAKGEEEAFGVKTVGLVVVAPGGVLLTISQLTDLDEFFNGSIVNEIESKVCANTNVTSLNYTPRTINVTATVTAKIDLKTNIETALTTLLNPDATFSDGTVRWEFGQTVTTSDIICAIRDVDELNISDVSMSVPAANTVLGNRELPLVGTLTITMSLV